MIWPSFKILGGVEDEKKKSFGNLCALKLFSGNREGDSTYIETAVKQNVLIMGQMRDSLFFGLFVLNAVELP